MSSIIRVIKENKQGIAIGTQLHFGSFSDHARHDNPNLWDSIGYYTYQDLSGKLNIVDEKTISEIYDCTINVIKAENCKTLVTGDAYWKIIVNERECGFHKLENNGRAHAKPFTIYKDTVYRNTNSSYPAGIRRFASLEEAEICLAELKKANPHVTKEWLSNFGLKVE